MPNKRATKQEIEKRIELVMNLIVLGKGPGSIVDHLMKSEDICLRQAQRYYAQTKERLAESSEKTYAERLEMAFKRNEMLQRQALSQKDFNTYDRSIKNEIQLIRTLAQYTQPLRGVNSDESSSIEATTLSSELEELLAAFRAEGKNTDNKTTE
jgi:hypothetical protein